MVRSASTDSVLVGRLSTLVARARSAVTGAHAPLWSEFARFWTVSFPSSRTGPGGGGWRRPCCSSRSLAIGFWVAGSHEVQSALSTPAEIEQLVNHDFASYHSENPAGSFALQVWVNNSWVAAQCIAFSILLGIPIPWVLFQNAANLGVIGGLMFQAGKADVLFGLLIPHGLLELSAVFLAGAVGMRLGWTVTRRVSGPRVRSWPNRVAAVVAAAVGLVVVVLLVSGLIEAMVTRRRCRPSCGSASARGRGRFPGLRNLARAPCGAGRRDRRHRGRPDVVPTR